MDVDAVDMPTLREAVASWKANPAQVFNSITVGREKAVETARRAAEAQAFADAKVAAEAKTAAAEAKAAADAKVHLEIL